MDTLQLRRGMSFGTMLSIVLWAAAIVTQGVHGDDQGQRDDAANKNRTSGDRNKERKAEIDAAIGRVRDLGAFVREFHPRDHPDYWVQIISTGMGAGTRQTAPDFDNDAMSDVEIIARGVKLQLHLRMTSVTATGLERLATVGRIDLLELTGPNIDDSMLPCLSKLPLHGQLGLRSDLLTNSGIKCVAECRDLKGISLDGNELTDACLEELIHLPKLSSVGLGKSFTRDAFQILGRLPTLTSLDVTQVTPELDDLKKVPKLRRLSLWGPNCDDDSARTIAETFLSLEEAYLRQTSITNAGVEHLSSLKSLKILTLDGAAIDDGVADTIRKMKQLKWLSVEKCEIGNETLAAIGECPSMWFVSLTDTRVTDDGVAKLVRLKEPLHLSLRNCGSVTDASIPSLMRLPDHQGTQINLQNSDVTEEGARELQTALPHAQITWGVPAVNLKEKK